MTNLKRREDNAKKIFVPSRQSIQAYASKRIAVLRLHLPDGRILTNQLLDFDEAGRIISYSPLCKEVAFCEWFRGDWYFEEL